jgi:phenylpropionate dioxygenase-like ring-hydroxylating dioxygenase large terminal subunit
MMQSTKADVRREWPAEGVTRIPYWVFSDAEVLAQEFKNIHRGRTWNFLCLEAEVPNPGDFKTTFVGDMPVIVTRGPDGELNCFENRCAHRGALLTLQNCGHARDFTCVYHAWRYDLTGTLKSVAFSRGVHGKGGMPASFDIAEHGPRKLRVATLNGLIFGTLSDQTPPLEEYLGAEVVQRLKRVLIKPMSVLGQYTQVLPNNWKLYFENVKDPYHASILHTFFATFKITRLSQGGGVIVSESGGNHVSISEPPKTNKDEAYDKAGLRSNKEDKFRLADPSILDVVDEWGDQCNVQILSVFPGFVLATTQNSMVVRQILPKGVEETHLVWTFFGFDDDTEEMKTMRMRHANLVGPAGYVSMEDGAVGGFVQRGIAAAEDECSVMEMGGHDTESQDTRVTEASIRGFWKAYRAHMGM